MKRKRLVLSGLILLGFVLNHSLSLACTIFSLSTPTANYFASNEDFHFTDPAIRVVPGNTNDYGYVVFGWNSYLPSYPQGGINEYGICLDWAMVPAQKFKANPARKDPDDDIMYMILKKCRNINDVITLVKQYNCSHFAEEHLLVSGRNGDSCIIEWSGADYVFIRKTKDYQLITNFNISNPRLGGYPCNRFKAAGDFLNHAEIAKLKLGDVRDLLNKTHQEGSYVTSYSYIVDEKNLDIYVFINHDYSRFTLLNVKQELQKGLHQIQLSHERFKEM